MKGIFITYYYTTERKIKDLKENLFFICTLFSFVKKMAHSLQHPREKLLLIAISVLDTKPEVHFQSGRFFIRETELKSRIEKITFQFWKIRVFCTFVRGNFHRVISGGFVHGDLRLYSDILGAFSERDISDPKGFFCRTYFQFPLEFLIMFDLFRENTSENFNFSVL